MKRSFWIGLVILTAGIFITALPDDDRRIFSINEQHGPSLADSIGIIIILIAWSWFMHTVFRRRRQIFSRLGKKWVTVCIALIVSGSIAIVAGLVLNINFLLWAGIAVAVAGNFMMIIPAFKKLQAN